MTGHSREQTSTETALDHLAEQIFCDNAVVMVGSGFSRNASSSQRYPDWAELADQFREKLGRTGNAARYSDPMKLAEEVEARFGRAVLDQMIQAAIPDLQAKPSEIHRKLMKLPWQDIFTTNYDTLLERTAANLVEPHYTPVVTSEDLVYAGRPRIVKLHGSFPSQRPFIVTSEDFRRYPREHACMVNTVQQALIENTLCMIGFSGDDPNFLQWISWVRDHLGQSHSPKIYMLGFGESESPTEFWARAYRI